MNTIGTFRLGEAVTATPEDLTVLMDVNLGAALWLSQAVEPYMRAARQGLHRARVGPAGDRSDRRHGGLQPQQGGA